METGTTKLDFIMANGLASEQSKIKMIVEKAAALQELTVWSCTVLYQLVQVLVIIFPLAGITASCTPPNLTM